MSQDKLPANLPPEVKAAAERVEKNQYLIADKLDHRSKSGFKDHAFEIGAGIVGGALAGVGALAAANEIVPADRDFGNGVKAAIAVSAVVGAASGYVLTKKNIEAGIDGRDMKDARQAAKDIDKDLLILKSAHEKRIAQDHTV